MADHEEEQEAANIPIGERPEYAGLVPTPQQDIPNAVVPIAYSDQFRDTMDYMRTLVKTDERSARALALCGEAIELNPANYSLWHFRRLILESLGSDLQQERARLTEIIRENQKNYQVWFHRQWLTSKLRDLTEELEFLAEMAGEEPKNYHAWSYRLWLVRHFHLADDESSRNAELEYTASLLQQDHRNNSAWNHRFAVVALAQDSGALPNAAAAWDSELQFALDSIAKSPNNESAWNYARGCAAKTKAWSTLGGKATEITNYASSCAFAWSTLMDCSAETKPTAASIAEWEAMHASALQACRKLIEIDPIRTKYWVYRESLLRAEKPIDA